MCVGRQSLNKTCERTTAWSICGCANRVLNAEIMRVWSFWFGYNASAQKSCRPPGVAQFSLSFICIYINNYWYSCVLINRNKCFCKSVVGVDMLDSILNTSLAYRSQKEKDADSKYQIINRWKHWIEVIDECHSDKSLINKLHIN